MNIQSLAEACRSQNMGSRVHFSTKDGLLYNILISDNGFVPENKQSFFSYGHQTLEDAIASGYKFLKKQGE